ncbi:hypothetical protein ZIOFF_002761 [Zingiber officinale]|uniref:Uncharacterized protein n=1 Tax=Zingiber officinale TaxID=94328 RepID=A0A8J5I5N1_ZINOF|nr:hypothetical protein ZIOFF_002761 [Zingiber officinale]
METYMWENKDASGRERRCKTDIAEPYLEYIKEWFCSRGLDFGHEGPSLRGIEFSAPKVLDLGSNSEGLKVSTSVLEIPTPIPKFTPPIPAECAVSGILRNQIKMKRLRSLWFIILIIAYWRTVVVAEYLKYKDPKQPLNVRIEDLLGRMTLAEKIGQMSQIERGIAIANPETLKTYFIGSVLSGGGSVPSPQASTEAWVNMVNGIQKVALSTRLGIPVIYGVDAVHGHNNVYKATVFPHNVGLGATRQFMKVALTSKVPDEILSWTTLLSSAISFHCLIRMLQLRSKDPALVKKIGAVTALEVRATGIPYVFAPCVAVIDNDAISTLFLTLDDHAARCNILLISTESYSEDPKVVQAMTEIIPGLQGDVPPNSQGIPFVAGRRNVAACAKHYVGDGGTYKGINEYNTIVSEHGLLSIHMPPYYSAISKGVFTVMVSYSSWNGVKMHANHFLVTDFLKNKLHFRGFVISDCQGVDRITTPEHANYTYSIETGILAGIDMNYKFSNIDRSFSLIFCLCLWQIMIPYAYTEFISDLTNLVQKNVIPISRIDDAVRRILRVKFTMGLFENPYADPSLADQLGKQEHRDLAREAVRKSLVLLKNGKSANNPVLPLPKKAKKVLVAGSHADNLGYQCGGWTITWQGESGNSLTIGTTILNAIRSTIDPSTPVIYSEKLCEAQRPYIGTIDALVAAWLPGTEGQGVADVLFGDYGFSGKLPRTWFKSVEQLPLNFGDPHYDPLFPYGFGLTTKPVKEN